MQNRHHMIGILAEMSPLQIKGKDDQGRYFLEIIVDVAPLGRAKKVERIPARVWDGLAQEVARDLAEGDTVSVHSHIKTRMIEGPRGKYPWLELDVYRIGMAVACNDAIVFGKVTAIGEIVVTPGGFPRLDVTVRSWTNLEAARNVKKDHDVVVSIFGEWVNKWKQVLRLGQYVSCVGMIQSHETRTGRLGILWLVRGMEILGTKPAKPVPKKPWEHDPGPGDDDDPGPEAGPWLEEA